MDVTQALKDAENSLRDFIANTLETKFGSDWPTKCGLTTHQLEQWKAHKAKEAERQQFGTVDERLIYYASFGDLKTLLKNNWSATFTDALGDKDTILVWLSTLANLRDPDAHRRELLPHQQHLAKGIAGEIRTRLVRYRSKQETGEDYFPRIELARDNYGNVYPRSYEASKAKTILRPGDLLEFVVTASDPLGEQLEYSFVFSRIDLNEQLPSLWQTENVLTIPITDIFIGRDVLIGIAVRSLRPYHASKHWDALAPFEYDILPAKVAPK